MIAERSLSRQNQLPLTVHTPPLGLAMEHQFHGRALTPLRFKGNCFLADAHAEKLRIIGIMKDLDPCRRQQPALHRRCAWSDSIEEESIITDVQIFEAMFSRLGVIPNQVAVLAGDRLHLHIHIQAVIHTGSGDVEQEILTVFPGEAQVITGISGFQFKQIHVGI